MAVSRLRFVVPLLLCALVAAGAVNGVADPAPAPDPAVRAAEGAAARHRIGELEETFGLRSRRDPRWALVGGFYARPAPGGMWAAWLRLERGRWRLVYAGRDRRAIEPPRRASVPCDVRPAFAEPSC